MITGFRHTGIVVDKMELQLKFYRDILGMEVYYDKYEDGSWLYQIIPMNPDHYARIVKLGRDGKVMVELLQFKEWIYNGNNLKEYNERGITHIALSVDNLQTVYDLLKSYKITLLSEEPKTNPEKTAKVCFCRDFEGNLIELVEILSI